MKQFLKTFSDVLLSLVVIATISGTSIAVYRLFAAPVVVKLQPIVTSANCWGRNA